MADDRFKDSIAGLSRVLGERLASHPDPVGEAMERRAAVQARFVAQEERRLWLIRSAAVLVGSACLTILILFLAWPPSAPLSSLPAATAPVMIASAAPVPQAAPVEAAPAPPVVVAAAPPGVAADPAPVPPPSPLERDEVREIQKSLFTFGFDPGPADGTAGRMTEAAIFQYQQKRVLAPTGKPDRALLDQLRQDPAPKVAPPQIASPPVASPPVASPQVAQQAQRREPPRQGSGPLDLLRTADGNISRWLNSLSR